MTASASRVQTPTTPQLHNRPASRTCLPSILLTNGTAPTVSALPKPSPPPKPPTQPTQTVPATGTRLQGTQNLVQALGTAYDLGNAASTQQLSGGCFPREFFNVVFAVLNAASGQMLNYLQLMKHLDFKEAWTHSLENKFGRLFQGIGGCTAKSTNTCISSTSNRYRQTDLGT